MNEQEKQQQLEIQKGFNAGYLLEKLNPKLSQKLREGMADKQHPFSLGFTKGAEQFNQESLFDSPPPNMVDDVNELDMDNPNLDLGKDKSDGFER